ncbi:hypothetical protein K1719_046227 [Acacia pycnantha]|nr:hypothetical protein K1719_046227 [Acacia pycnantha]
MVSWISHIYLVSKWWKSNNKILGYSQDTGGTSRADQGFRGKTQESNRGGRKFWYTRKKKLQEPQRSSQAPFKPYGSSSGVEQRDGGHHMFMAPLSKSSNDGYPFKALYRHAPSKPVMVVTLFGPCIDRDVGNSTTLTSYTSNTTGGRSCFLTNTNEHQDAYTNLRDGNDKYFVPAWSVTILVNCAMEVFNSAKVNSQTSLMVKKSND